MTSYHLTACLTTYHKLFTKHQQEGESIDGDREGIKDSHDHGTSKRKKNHKPYINLKHVCCLKNSCNNKAVYDFQEFLNVSEVSD